MKPHYRLLARTPPPAMPHATCLKFPPAPVDLGYFQKEKEKEGLLPMRGLNILKTDSRSRCSAVARRLPSSVEDTRHSSKILNDRQPQPAALLLLHPRGG